MTELARAAGLSKPALYRYFPNKQAIYRQLALDMFAENQAMVAKGLAREDADRARVLREAIRGYCAMQHARPYRTHLRAAISANPELADLDIADSRTNAATVSRSLADTDVRPQDRDDTLFLMMSLVDTLAHVTRRVPQDEAGRLMDRFGTVFAEALGLPRGAQGD